VIHLTAIAFLYDHPEDDRITGRNMLVNMLQLKIHNKIKVLLLVVYTFYLIKPNVFVIVVPLHQHTTNFDTRMLICIEY
jgi:hypothetical protein